jgi:hypothetical protein
MRIKILFVLIVAGVFANGARAQLTANVRIVAGTAPAVIPRDYNIGPSLPGPIPVGTPINFAYGVEVPVGNSTAVTIAAQPPPSFVPVLTRCVKFPNGGTTGTPFPCTLPTIMPGPLSAPDDQVIVTIDGYFKQAGPVTLPFNVTRGSESLPTPISINVTIDTLPADIEVTKLVKPKTSGAFGPSATVAFGGTVTYKIRVRNASAIAADHHTDLYLEPLLKLRDILSTPATNDVNLNILASSFVCTPTGGAVCPTVPGSSINPSLGHPVAQSFLTTMSYPTTSNGLLPAGDSFEVTFDATISTSAACSPGQNNTLGNTADITYSNNTSTISDVDPTNNSSSTTVTLTGLPTTGCSGGGTGTPTLTMTKSLVTTTPAWGVPMAYRIKFTNTTGQTLTGLTLTDVVINSGVPPFTATFAATSVVCTLAAACANTTPSTNAPWVTGSSTLFTIALAPIANNDTVIVDYTVRHDTPCSPTGTGGVITNRAQLSGPATGITSVCHDNASAAVVQPLRNEDQHRSGHLLLVSGNARLQRPFQEQLADAECPGRDARGRGRIRESGVRQPH